MATKPLIITDTTPIQVFARVHGSLHWLCPVCHFIHNETKINWRAPRVMCDGRWHPIGQCKKSFRLGIWFNRLDDTAGDPLGQSCPPFSAYLAPQLTSFVVNRLGASALADYKPAIAHINGSLEYVCPACHTWDRQRIDYLGAVRCPACSVAWRTGVIFHPPSARTHRLHCPRDWSVSREPI